MSKKFSPSPPASESKEGSYDLHRIAQHNATALHRQDQFNFDASDYLPSASTTSFNSPQSDHRVLDHYGRSYHSTAASLGDLGIAYQTDPYGNPVYQPYQSGAFYATPPPQDMYNGGYQIASTPTPAHSDRSENRKGVKRSRNRHHSTTDDDYPSSMSAQPLKPAKNLKPVKGDLPKLSAPLSELAKEMKNVVLIDKEAEANRSSEKRRQEVVNDKGKIKRPQNSFILYRSAHANVAKAILGADNHQLVSSLCGQSWAIESPEVRERFAEIAKLERDNHAKAHPGYKFSPSKPPNLGRKRKGAESDEEDDFSDLGNEDFEWKPSSSRGGNRAKREKIETHLTPWSSDPVPYQGYETQGMGYGVVTSQTLYQPNQYGQYFQTGVYPNAHVPTIGNTYVHTHPLDQPQMDHLESSEHLIGLPGVDSYNSLEQDAHSTYDDDPSLTAEAHVDPLLMSYQNDVEGHDTQARSSAGLHGLADIQAYNKIHDEGRSPEEDGSMIDQD